MAEPLPLLAIAYFVAVILGIYHVQQQDLDRLSREIEEILRRINSGHSSASRNWDDIGSREKCKRKATGTPAGLRM